MLVEVQTYGELCTKLERHGLFLGEACLSGDPEGFGVCVCSEEPKGEPQAVVARVLGFENSLRLGGAIFRSAKIYPLGGHALRSSGGFVTVHEETRLERPIPPEEIKKFAERAKKLLDTG